MLIQLCYSSRYSPTEFTLIEDIRDILVTARRFNEKNDIYGVLYYADGYFFQCLEGNDEAVRNLYKNISKDSRHHDLTLLKINPIQNIKFNNWTMKYVEHLSPVKSLLSDLNLDIFDLNHLTPQNLERLIDILYIESEGNLDLNSNTLKSRNYSHYF
ncbi:hypothetical protein B9T31_02270 [Acinetobacter sp. ANC 4558]|uniref:BLUF domain-containing protein n=1 Tax=Acinetobacter sp. ANC 4558 TaxID=1977876 RepID=UPI000A34C087|nr:BLUF domain-containing protein [Acinetobacter sp. ANC 4558]OTG88356.1 hypothetical protein B9T31_02270 [Acinetobacter sp. ANC 4558]